jgi:two-component system sensor histidine kinase BarA
MKAFPAVLYVEDDPRSRKIMRMLLRGEMELEHITIFEDSANFAQRLQAIQPQPNIILLDIHVKPYTGFEMLDMVRQLPEFQNTPVIALTASVMNEEIQHLRDSGFQGVIAKPVDIDTFPALVDRILDGEIIWRIVQ